MILVGRYLSPFVRRVGISLKLLDIPFERRELSTRDDFAELVKINPLGRVPAMILDDGEVLVDSSAMLDYLDEQVGPERALIPARGAERRHVLRLLGLAQGVFDKTLAVNFERNHHPEQERNQDWIARCTTQVANGLAAMNEQTQAPWSIGGRLTQADITLICAWDFTGRVLPDVIAAGDYAGLRAVVERCNGMAEVVETRFTSG